MATKPAAIQIRASDTNYTNGDPVLIGTATKITRTGLQIDEGWLVDAPALGDHPVGAQHVNFFDNRTDVHLEWVDNGTFNPTLDAHIVETSSLGLLSAGFAAFTGSVTNTTLDVTGVASNPAIDVTSGANGVGVQIAGNGTAAGIDVTHPGTGNGINVDQTNIASAARFTNSSGNALQAISTGGSSAATFTGNNGSGVRVTMTGTGPALQLNKNTTSPTVFPVDSGGVHCKDTGSDDADYLGVRLNGNDDYIQTAKTKMVYGYDNIASDSITGAATISFVTPLHASALPDSGSLEVLIEMSGQFKFSGQTQELSATIVIDDDNGPVTGIRTFTFGWDESLGSFFRPFYWRFPYTLTQNGANSFTATLSTLGGGTVVVDVVDWIMTIKSNPS